MGMLFCTKLFITLLPSTYDTFEIIFLIEKAREGKRQAREYENCIEWRYAGRRMDDVEGQQPDIWIY